LKLMEKAHKNPSDFLERERLREKGQFWTPDWIAEAMIGYIISEGNQEVFDPAVGAGAFFRAAKKMAREKGIELTLTGMEIDSNALEEAKKRGLSDSDLAQVVIGDFLVSPQPEKRKAIVANPPYIRHHRLTADCKATLKKLALETIGEQLDGRAGIHIYFLLRALVSLSQRGKLAFIMPADTVEGLSAPVLWNWIARNYRLDAVVTFLPDATPFPTVDTNPLIFLIRNDIPQDSFYWVKCTKANTSQLKEWTLSGLRTITLNDLVIYERSLSEALITGLSRPIPSKEQIGMTLSCFARVMRGVATGANAFFFLTVEQAKALKIPNEFLTQAVGRTRDIKGCEFTKNDLDQLQAKGRPTLLFSPDKRSIDQFPIHVREYLKLGEAKRLNRRPLIASRRPWYKMETRPPPPIIFTYLGRRDVRFIANKAQVIPLTGFLCIYPRQDNAEFVDKLLTALRHPQTIENLRFVGKTYGNGAIKVEPRALEKLCIPTSVLNQADLEVPYEKPRELQTTLC